jgi:hypothetical protein
MRNLQRSLLAFSFMLFCVVRANGQITGVIDGVYYRNGLTVAAGWACDYGHPESVAVHLYAGGPAGTGTFVNAATANLPSDGAVAAACGSTGSNYRFEIDIGDYQAQNVGKTIYVHGISISGGPNYTIYNSGAFIFPDSIYGYMKDQNGADSEVQIHVSSKYAGAIDDLYWHGQHFVDNADHGRQFQMAAQFHGYNECYNPTEAGSIADMDNPGSSSLLTYLSTYANEFYTRNIPAFWLQGPYSDANANFSSSPNCTDELGGLPQNAPPVDHHTRNQTNRSTYQFAKGVYIGFTPAPPYAPIPNAIEMLCQFFIPSAQNENYVMQFPNGAATSGNGMQLQAPSGAMPASFSNIYEYDLNGHLTPLFTCADCANPANWSNSCCQTWRRLPVVLEDPSTGNAMGLYAPDVLNSPTAVFGVSNAYVNYTSGTPWPISGWSFLYNEYGPVPQGTMVSHRAYVALGATKDQVKNVLNSLHTYFKNTGQVP